MKKNITLSMDDELLTAGRRYARQHRTTLNQLVRDLLEGTVKASPNGSWQDVFFDLADQAAGKSDGSKWKREDLYDVQNLP